MIDLLQSPDGKKLTSDGQTLLTEIHHELTEIEVEDARSEALDQLRNACQQAHEDLVKEHPEAARLLTPILVDIAHTEAKRIDPSDPETRTQSEAIQTAAIRVITTVADEDLYTEYTESEFTVTELYETLWDTAVETTSWTVQMAALDAIGELCRHDSTVLGDVIDEQTLRVELQPISDVRSEFERLHQLQQTIKQTVETHLETYPMGVALHTPVFADLLEETLEQYFPDTMTEQRLRGTNKRLQRDLSEIVASLAPNDVVSTNQPLITVFDQTAFDRASVISILAQTVEDGATLSARREALHALAGLCFTYSEEIATHCSNLHVTTVFDTLLSTQKDQDILRAGACLLAALGTRDALEFDTVAKRHIRAQLNSLIGVDDDEIRIYLGILVIDEVAAIDVLFSHQLNERETIQLLGSNPHIARRVGSCVPNWLTAHLCHQLVFSNSTVSDDESRQFTHAIGEISAQIDSEVTERKMLEALRQQVRETEGLERERFAMVLGEVVSRVSLNTTDGEIFAALRQVRETNDNKHWVPTLILGEMSAQVDSEITAIEGFEGLRRRVRETEGYERNFYAEALGAAMAQIGLEATKDEVLWMLRKRVHETESYERQLLIRALGEMSAQVDFEGAEKESFRVLQKRVRETNGFERRNLTVVLGEVSAQVDLEPSERDVFEALRQRVHQTDDIQRRRLTQALGEVCVCMNSIATEWRLLNVFRQAVRETDDDQRRNFTVAIGEVLAQVDLEATEEEVLEDLRKQICESEGSERRRLSRAIGEVWTHTNWETAEEIIVKTLRQEVCQADGDERQNLAVSLGEVSAQIYQGDRGMNVLEALGQRVRQADGDERKLFARVLGEMSADVEWGAGEDEALKKLREVVRKSDGKEYRTLTVALGEVSAQVDLKVTHGKVLEILRQQIPKNDNYKRRLLVRVLGELSVLVNQEDTERETIEMFAQRVWQADSDEVWELTQALGEVSAQVDWRGIEKDRVKIFNFLSRRVRETDGDERRRLALALGGVVAHLEWEAGEGELTEALSQLIIEKHNPERRWIAQALVETYRHVDCLNINEPLETLKKRVHEAEGFQRRRSNIRALGEVSAQIDWEKRRRPVLEELSQQVYLSDSDERSRFIFAIGLVTAQSFPFHKVMLDEPHVLDKQYVRQQLASVLSVEEFFAAFTPEDDDKPDLSPLFDSDEQARRSALYILATILEADRSYHHDETVRAQLEAFLSDSTVPRGTQNQAVRALKHLDSTATTDPLT